MEGWKQAFWLAKFELKASIVSFFLFLLIFSFIVLGFITSFNSYLQHNFAGTDLIFILIFTVAPMWAKPKKFQIQYMDNELVAAPTIMMLKQLPVPVDTIIKSRFIIYFIYALPFQFLLLSSLYIFSPSLQEMLPVGPYLAFAIMWLSFGLYIGCIFPASEAGEKTSVLKAVLYVVAMLVIAIVFFTTIILLFDNGLVHLTLIIAQKWPLITATLSVSLALFGLRYWQSYMKKTMRKIDYL